MFIKRILKIGLVAIVASALTTVQAQVPQPAPKPDKPTKEKPERGGKKWDSEKVKARLKAAFDQRKKKRGKDAKKRGNKVHDRKKGDHKKGGAFGKLVRDDAKIKELKEGFCCCLQEGSTRGLIEKHGKMPPTTRRRLLERKWPLGEKSGTRR